MKKFIFAAMTVIGLTGVGLADATTAFASDDGWYALVGAGQTTGNFNDKSSHDGELTALGATGFASSMSTPTVYKLQLGYQINRNFAIEGGYLASNNQTYNAIGGNLPAPFNMSTSTKGWNITVVGMLPLSEQFSLLGKMGIAAIDESGTVSFGGRSAPASGSKTDLTYGIGAKYDFTKTIFGRFDVDNYSVGSSTASSRGSVWMFDVGIHF